VKDAGPDEPLYEHHGLVVPRLVVRHLARRHLARRRLASRDQTIKRDRSPSAQAEEPCRLAPEEEAAGAVTPDAPVEEVALSRR
jgi:hypothetical protein